MMFRTVDVLKRRWIRSCGYYSRSIIYVDSTWDNCVAEFTVTLQMSQEYLTFASATLVHESASLALLLTSTGSGSPSDSLASSEEKSWPLDDLSHDELVDGVVDSELSASTLSSLA